MCNITFRTFNRAIELFIHFFIFPSEHILAFIKKKRSKLFIGCLVFLFLFLRLNTFNSSDKAINSEN